MDSFLQGAMKRVRTFGEEAGKYANEAGKYANDSVTYAKGLYNQQKQHKAHFARVIGVSLPRAHHTVSVVNGRAYIFGGEAAPDKLASNDMQVIILPSSGVLEADYKTIPARPREANGPVPAPRKEHVTMVVGELMYLFGGKLEGTAAEEQGRLWIFDTVDNTWSYLDPAPDAPFPQLRYQHTGVSSELPGSKDANPTKVEWGLDFKKQEHDPTEELTEPPARDSWGTLFIYGGKAAKGQGEEVLNDVWTFDVRTRKWYALPTPRGSANVGATLVLSGDKLCLFSGQAGPTLRYIDVSPLWKFGDRGTALGDVASTSLAADWAVLEAEQAPEERTHAALVDVPGARPHELLLVGGEGFGKIGTTEKAKEPAPTETMSDGSSLYLEDVWLYQINTNAPIKEATRHDMGRTAEAASWAEVEAQLVDEYGDTVETTGVPGFGRRGSFAFARGSEVDGSHMIIWGGKSADGKFFGDGWLITKDQ